jgi:hypothetical protein
MTDADAWGSELASWAPLVTLLVVFGAIVVALFVFGRGQLFERIPDALQRLTGIPGWAAAGAGTAMYGLAVAGEGFYSDVAWHIALGRDKELFTAPHTAIAIGLGMIFVSAAVGIVAATAQGVPTRLRLGALRVPWSMLPLAALGGTALAGFPLDEVWHGAYGIDVTMWSPTHMMMILGASFTGLGIWLVLAEAGVSPRDSRWARAAHVLAAALTILGLSASQGEFDFGVPQFQHVFHPLLVTLTAAFALVVIRMVHGRGWVLGIAGGLFLLQTLVMGETEPVATTGGAHLYVASALVVEVVAWLLGTERLLRFALASGVGVGTLGLAGEWAWSQTGRQPWRASMLPDAVLLCLVVGVGAAVVGAAFGRAIVAGIASRGTGSPPHPSPGPAPLRRGAVALGGAAVVLALVLPLPRQVGDVEADIRVEPAEEEGHVTVRATLAPEDAAVDARWFQVLAWQGGGLVVADMEEVGPGEYEAGEPLPVTGRWKAILRLHRGGEMMAAPVRFPADEEIGEGEIPAEDRVIELGGERRYLLRETTGSGGLLSDAVHGTFALGLVLWAVVFARSTGRIASVPAPEDATPVASSGARTEAVAGRR